MTKSSSWTPLQNPVFRRLWIASLVSGICVSAHDTAATRTMNMLAPSPLLISLMSTAASLPFFLFTLPAGALADMVDCKKLLCGINLWLAVAAASLAIPVWLRLINPGLILVWVFLMGIGFAFNAPASISIVPEIVSDAELPAATNLSGLQLNLAGIVGPPLGGLLVQLLGASFVFLVNAACFLFVIIAIRRWKRAIEQPELRLENFLESFMTVFRYVRFAPRLQIVLTRNVLFALFISVIPALVPVVGLRALHLGPCQLGILFTSMGAGSIAAAAFISLAKSPILFKYSDFTSKFTCGVCLCVNGIYSPDRAIPGCRGAGRCWVDSVCFRTLGGGTTCYAKLGARSHERRSHHGFAGSYGSWWSDLGLYSHEGWTEFYIAWRGVPVPD